MALMQTEKIYNLLRLGQIEKVQLGLLTHCCKDDIISNLQKCGFERATKTKDGAG